VSQQVSVGEMLILREEFRRACGSETLASSGRKRAEVLVRVIDELIQRRENEAAADPNRPPAIFEREVLP
jgi:hypothetical protein